MKRLKASLLFGGGLLAIAGTTVAYAQEVPPTARSGIERDRSQVEDIVVTAQRRTENLQSVPLTVSVVTAKDLDEYKLQRFEDVQQLTPGLSLDRTGRIVNATLRGVTFNPDAGAGPTIDTYFNEVPIDPQFQFQSIFDVQQIEVLRGPQGLLRGRPAPTGAITLTTRRPSYQEFGGTASATYSSFDNVNLQAAVGGPIVKDRIAVRIAALYDKTDVNGVYNITQDLSSRRTNRGFRATLAVKPIDDLELTLMHNRLRVHNRSFSAVEGPGLGYNGPAITDGSDHRIAVSEGPASFPVKVDLTIFNANYNLGKLGRLFYNFGRLNAENKAINDGDTANVLPNYSSTQAVFGPDHVRSHELRWESSFFDDFIDATLGLWHYKRNVTTQVNPQPPNFRPGAFGNPATPVVGAPNLNYSLPITVVIPSVSKNKAVYGNLVFNFTKRTNLSVGARYFDNEGSNQQTTYVGSGLQAQRIGVPCNFLSAPFTGSSTYPGTCDLRIAASVQTQTSYQRNKEWLYGVSIRHNFTDDILAYATYGNSFRGGGATSGLRGVPDSALFYKPEKSDSYELGLKTEWLDRRLRVNVSIFRQDFKGYINTTGFTVPYISNVGTSTETLNAAGGFTFNADAYTEGGEIEIDARPTDNWSFALNLAQSRARYKGGLIPCRDSNNDGTPDNAPLPANYRPLNGATFATCQARGTVNATPVPKFNLNAQSEVTMPLGTHDAEGYLRGLVNYRTKGVAQSYSTPSYAIVNLFAGVRNDQWDFGVYARNLFDAEPLVSNRNIAPITATDLQFPSGYQAVNYLRGRELGVSFRFSFGGG